MAARFRPSNNTNRCKPSQGELPSNPAVRNHTLVSAPASRRASPTTPCCPTVGSPSAVPAESPRLGSRSPPRTDGDKSIGWLSRSKTTGVDVFGAPQIASGTFGDFGNEVDDRMVVESSRCRLNLLPQCTTQSAEPTGHSGPKPSTVIQRARLALPRIWRIARHGHEIG